MKKSFFTVETFFTVTITVILAITVTSVALNFNNEMKLSTVNNCKVVDLQQQSIISGTDKSVSTQIRYLIITEKETFICESSLINGKFNNSDVFWHLKKDSTYNFTVSGRGKSFFFDYRNILEVVK